MFGVVITGGACRVSSWMTVGLPCLESFVGVDRMKQAAAGISPQQAGVPMRQPKY